MNEEKTRQRARTWPVRDTVLLKKPARIIMALKAGLYINEECALDLFCSTETQQRLSDLKYGLRLMSDGYIGKNALLELSGT